MSEGRLKGKVLVTGATGYVGGRLVPRLLESGYIVRAMVRDHDRLRGRPWVNGVEVVEGDALDKAALLHAMQGVWQAYYLIHSMAHTEDFSQRDLDAAEIFAHAASLSGVKRIIYLGGLGSSDADLSPHLRSRHQTGETLFHNQVPVIEFRSAMVVGSGSASFEMLRYMTEALPVILCPRWVNTRVQPISIRNVLEYLEAALELPFGEPRHEIIEIGGTDVLSYHEMIELYARERQLKRVLISLPFLTTSFCSRWAHWLTPIPRYTARALIEGLRNEVVVRDDKARRLFPSIQPWDYLTALRRALNRIQGEQVETTWSDALVTSMGDKRPVTLSTYHGLVLEKRQREVDQNQSRLFEAFTSLGGKNGWLYANFMWVLRGVIDNLVGGVGFRRGRRHPTELRVGDPLDFWRVEAIEPNRLLRLRAEMKLPGLAWLQFEARPLALQKSLLVQTAFFEPKGLLGLVYWYSLYPIHSLIFRGLMRKIAEKAEAMD